jgi:hypothetical protein
MIDCTIKMFGLGGSCTGRFKSEVQDLKVSSSSSALKLSKNGNACFGY